MNGYVNFENINPQVLEALSEDFGGRVENLDRFRKPGNLGVSVDVTTGELTYCDKEDLPESLVNDPSVILRGNLVDVKIDNKITFTFVEPAKS